MPKLDNLFNVKSFEPTVFTYQNVPYYINANYFIILLDGGLVQ